MTSLCALHTAAVTGTVDESADAEPLGRGLADYLLPSLSSRDLNSRVEFPILHHVYNVISTKFVAYD